MALVISDLHKNFGGKAVLRGFSLNLSDGERLALMGPSGCGKTTLMNIVMGFIKPDAGSVFFTKNARLSAVFQDERLVEPLSALMNVRLTAPKTVFEKDIIALLTTLGLEDSAYKPVSELSGGMRRRTALARALIADSDILLLDEPFDGLDNETKSRTIDCLRSHAGNRAILLVTHDESDALSLGAEIIHMQTL
jgi:NitT/TauT family transport system ATP-binding protein